MMFSSVYSRPPAYYNGTNRCRSSSLSRYSSPARPSHMSPSRSSLPLASPAFYGTTSNHSYRIHTSSPSSTVRSSRSSSHSRELSVTADVPYFVGYSGTSRRDSLGSQSSSRISLLARHSPAPSNITHPPEIVNPPNNECRNSQNSTYDSSSSSSFSRELPPKAPDSPYIGRRDSRSSLRSSRISSSISNSPAPTQKQVHFKEDEKETNTTTDMMDNSEAEQMQRINKKAERYARPKINLGPMAVQRFNRYAESDARMNVYGRDSYPSVSNDDSRKQQASKQYLNAVKFTNIMYYQ